MKKLTRVLALLLCASMLVSLAACKKTKQKKPNKTNSQTIYYDMKFYLNGDKFTLNGEYVDVVINLTDSVKKTLRFRGISYR